MTRGCTRLHEIAREYPPRPATSTAPFFGPDTPPANLGQSRAISGNLGQSQAISGNLARLGALGTFLGLDECDYAAMRREADPTRFALPGLHAPAQRGITPFHRVSIS